MKKKRITTLKKFLKNNKENGGKNPSSNFEEKSLDASMAREIKNKKKGKNIYFIVF